MTSKLALLDFEGTLSTGSISVEFIMYLNRERVLQSEIARRVLDAKWKKDEGRVSNEEWIKTLIESWGDGVKGRNSREISEHASKFFREFSPKIYSSSYDLVSFLKAMHYHPITVSASIYEVVALGAKALGVPEIYCSVAETINGVYTGRIETDIHLPNGKTRVFSGLVRRFDMRDSMAFGDSMSDHGMLEMVEKPVALNPVEELRAIAERRKWTVLNNKTVLEGVRRVVKERRRIYS